MIRYSEAKYIREQIENMKLYEQFIAEYNAKLIELQMEIDSLSEPSSPNGRASIGEAKGNSISDYTERLTQILTDKASYELELNLYRWLMKKAQKYYDQLLRGESAEFVKDYFSTADKRSLQEKYHIGNVYDRILRVIRNEVTGK